MRKRSAMRSGGASTWLAGAGCWTGAHVGTGRPQDRRIATEAEATAVGGKRKGNGVNPASCRLIYRRGPPNLPVVVPSAVQHASTALFREVRENIKAYFSLIEHNCDLNLSLGRQLNNKTTSGCPDGKHVLQAPTLYLFRSLTSHLVKTTKHMTEESEHYMDRSKVHKSPTTSLLPEPVTKEKHTTRLEPPRAVTMTYFAEAEHVARLLLALGP
jgi:hypothetical protein